MGRTTRKTRRIAFVTVMVGGALALAGSANAADTVSVVVSPGIRTASVANLSLTTVGYSFIPQTQTGTMTLSADDSTGSGLGWNVTIQSSAFLYTGSNGGTSIPAANFSLITANAPTATAGQAVDSTSGPMVPSTSPAGVLSAARKTVQANAAYGQGAYSQNLDVSLDIPALARAGTYTGTLTTTISAAP